jgi:hypothetical protein
MRHGWNHFRRVLSVFLSTSGAKLGCFSLCFVGVPFSFKPGLSRHSNDGLLDFLRQVSP